MIIPTAITTALAGHTTSGDDEYLYADDDNSYIDFDGDGDLTEYDVDRMCDEDYVEEEYKEKEKCKGMYEEIEERYGYETEENEHEDDDDRE